MIFLFWQAHGSALPGEGRERRPFPVPLRYVHGAVGSVSLLVHQVAGPAGRDGRDSPVRDQRRLLLPAVVGPASGTVRRHQGEAHS